MPIADSEPPRIEQPAPAQAAAEQGEGGGTRIQLPIVAPAHERCGEGAPSGDIVVCATNPEVFRLRPLPDSYGPPPPRGLSAKLGESVTVQQDLEQVGISGVPSHRVMAKVKIAF